ncbi:MAG: DUF4116 domain-containing protein [Parachlamydiaceae bacterium]|nr:DUF4116 domain-containing protein [Parachlamydiaceae bacterium]
MFALFSYFGLGSTSPADATSTKSRKSILTIPNRALYKIISYCNVDDRLGLLFFTKQINFCVKFQSTKEKNRLFLNLRLIVSRCLKIEVIGEIERVLTNPELHRHAYDKRFREEAIYSNLYPVLKQEYDSNSDFKNNRDGLLLLFKSMQCAVKNHILEEVTISSQLKCDESFIIDLAKVYVDAISLATKDLQSNKEFAIKVVKQNPLSLIRMNNFCDDKDVVLVAVKLDGLALIAASPRLKNDNEVVKAAVKNDGSALAYASRELQNDSMIVLAAVRNKRYALKFSTEEAKEVVLILLGFAEDRKKNKSQQKAQVSGNTYCLLS